MNKRIRIIVFTILILVICVSIRNNVFLNTKDDADKEVYTDAKNENMLSMMLEIEAGSGNYEMTTRDSWPTDGYVFNSELSKCENGGELS